MKKTSTILIISLLVLLFYYLHDETLVNEKERQGSAVVCDSFKNESERLDSVVVCDTLKNAVKPRRVDFKLEKPGTFEPPILIDTFFYLIDYVPGDSLRQIVCQEKIIRDSLLEKFVFDYFKEKLFKLGKPGWIEIKRDSISEYVYCYSGYSKQYMFLLQSFRFENKKWVGVDYIPGVWGEVPPPSDEDYLVPMEM